MTTAIAVADSPIEQALTTARQMIEKIKVAMVKIYYIFAKDDIQKGISQLPDVVSGVLKQGVEMIVKAIQVIVDGIQTVREKGYVVIALLKEVPNIVDATVDLLDEASAKAAQTSARIAAFTAVFVEEKFGDIQAMLTLLAKLLLAVAGTPDKAYKPNEAFKLTAAQLGFDPAVGPAIPTEPPALKAANADKPADKPADKTPG